MILIKMEVLLKKIENEVLIKNFQQDVSYKKPIILEVLSFVKLIGFVRALVH